MIFIIISWFYITLVSFLTGCLFNRILKNIFRLPQKDQLHFSVICINGFLFTSMIMAVWVLFFKVSLATNIFVFVLAVFSFIINKREISRKLKDYFDAVKKASKAIWFFFLLFVLVLSCISYMPSAHADDAGCFTPLIRWMQEYGTVPGIANLDARLGYNSSWFVLQALYGFDFLKAGIFNDLNGLVFLYTFLYSLTSIDQLLKGTSSFSHYLKAGFFLPVLFMYFGYSDDVMIISIQFFTNPTYDVPVTFILWILFFLFLELKDQVHEQPGLLPVQAYLIPLYSVYLVTVKLNAAPAVLMGLFIAVFMIIRKRYRNIFFVSLIALIIIVPWMIKTALGSGYLVFPVAEMDLLEVDWKLSARAVLYIENSIKTWAIDPFIYGTSGVPGDSSFFSVPVREWFPLWFRRQNFINTIIFFVVLLSGLAWLVWCYRRWLKMKNRFFRIYIFEIILSLTLLAGIILWFTRGPLFRYGYGYLVFICMIGVVRVVYFFIKEYHSAYTGIFILAYLFYSGIYYGFHIYEPVSTTFFKKPRYYSVPPYTRQDTGDGKYFNIVEAPACGYAPLPASPRYVYEYLKPRYRGTSVREGFANQRPAGEQHIQK